jgi:hypothetical protein
LRSGAGAAWIAGADAGGLGAVGARESHDASLASQREAGIDEHACREKVTNMSRCHPHSLQGIFATTSLTASRPDRRIVL